MSTTPPMAHLDAHLKNRSVRVAIVVAGWLLLASPVAATPIDVFFDGPSIAGDPNTNFGLSQTQAENARDNFGVQILTNFGTLGSVVGNYSTSQILQGFSPDPPVGAVNRATSAVSVTNVSGADFLGASYLIFTHTDPFVLQGMTIDYADVNVGLTIDSALGWVIFQTSAGGTNFYYPGILLDRSVPNPLQGVLADGQTADFDLQYVVQQPLVTTPDGIYQLPEFQVGRAFTPVPEPGTALLVAGGLLALGLRKRALH